MKEAFKNFLCLLFATLVWVAGFLLPLSVLFAAVELDIWYLLPAFVAAAVLLVGLWFAKRSHRFMAALEYPFGFFSGGKLAQLACITEEFRYSLVQFV